MSILHNTFVIEREYAAAPARVFAAFADPAKKRRWFAESRHHTIQEYSLDFRVGGAETARYRFNEGTPFPGAELASQGFHLEIAGDQRIVSASTMSLGGRAISAALVTIELAASGAGTKLICTHQAAFFEGSDGPQMREAGWRALFGQLEAELG